jgi:hypothetical protein
MDDRLNRMATNEVRKKKVRGRGWPQKAELQAQDEAAVN